MAHVVNNSGNNEWYTPDIYIQSVKNVFDGVIDLDPASCDLANKTINAVKFYTIYNSGLEKAWMGNVFLNPPYSKNSIKDFSNKVIEQVTLDNINQLIVLTNNATETGWWQSMAELSSSICLVKGRIKFNDFNGNKANSPLQGQSFMYFGNNSAVFDLEFKKFGVILNVQQ